MTKTWRPEDGRQSGEQKYRSNNEASSTLEPPPIFHTTPFRWQISNIFPAFHPVCTQMHLQRRFADEVDFVIDELNGLNTIFFKTRPH